MSDLQPQYLILEDLRKLESKVTRLEDLVEKIPVDIKTIQTKLEKRKSVFLSLKSIVEETEKKLRKYEIDLKEKEERVRKSEEKMMDVKTNEEFRAAQKEIETQKASKSLFEDQILTLLTDLDERRKELKKEEETFKGEESVVVVELQSLEKDLHQLESELSVERAKRIEASKQLPGDISSLYQKLTHRIRKNAISLIDNGICSGCNIRIRPQIYNEILGFRAVHCCSNCHRILIPKQPANATEESN